MNLNTITEWLGQLWGAPGVALIFIFCVFICKGLRTSKFPNSGVWLVMLTIGALLNVVIADPNSNDPLNKVITSYRVWIAKTAIIGGIVGQAAQSSYMMVLRKLPWFSGDDEPEEQPTP